MKGKQDTHRNGVVTVGFELGDVCCTNACRTVSTDSEGLVSIE